MALIGKIRKNSWVMVVLVGLGLGGFIIMDMTSGQQSVFGGSQFTVGKFEGEKLDWNKFYRTEQILYGNSAGDVYGRRDALWNYFVEEALILKEANALGLGVSNTELMDLQFGPTPSPVIVQRFQSATAPGQVDREQLNSLKQMIEGGGVQQAIADGQLNPQFVPYWEHQQKEIIKQRLQGKLSGLVSKAMYTPTWVAEMGHEEQNQRIDFAYVRVGYDKIENTEITLEDSDYEAYIKENKARFEEKEEMRKVDYVTFSVNPSSSDSIALRNKISDLGTKFEAAQDDSLFVLQNGGSIADAFFKKEELAAGISDTVFQIPVGSVYGPYFEEVPIAQPNIQFNISPNNQGQYKAVKVLERFVMSDSADTRHILINATTPAEFATAENRIDSLKNLLETRVASFDSLALKFSQDPGSSNNGGKYEGVTPNGFVPEYNRLLFITGVPGQLYKVRTQFGWHLIEILSLSPEKSERVRVAYVSEPIIPSQATQDSIIEIAQNFIAANRSLDQIHQTVNDDPNLNVETSPGVKKNDHAVGALGSSQDSRDIIRWAFSEASKGDVSPNVYSFQDATSFYTEKYIVIALNSIQKPGLPSVDDIRDDINFQVMNKKKAEMIIANIQGKGLEAIAAEYETQVDTAVNVSFQQASIPNVGSEPEVIGTALNLAENTVSGPIEGSSGVFVLQVTKKPTLAAATDLPRIRQTMSSAVRSRVNGALIQAMRKNADITDNRSKFY